MFYSTTTNSYIQEGTPFEINGVQYPANWLNLSTSEQKAEIGLEEVVATNEQQNQAYYWVSEELNGATLTYINTPKDLEVVKSTSIAQVKSTSYSLLFPTDWMVVKAVETNTTVAPEWNSWRESVRITASNAVGAINQALDVDSVESIMNSINWPVSPDQQPLGVI